MRQTAVRTIGAITRDVTQPKGGVNTLVSIGCVKFRASHLNNMGSSRLEPVPQRATLMFSDSGITVERTRRGRGSREGRGCVRPAFETSTWGTINRYCSFCSMLVPSLWTSTYHFP